MDTSREREEIKMDEKMKATGMVRRVDELGRIVIPKTIRQEFKIKEGMPLEIFIDEENQRVIFQKYSGWKN